MVSNQALKQVGCCTAVCLALVCSPVVAARPEMTIELLPAWDGLAVPGKTTEVGVRLTARDDGHASVRVRLPGMVSYAQTPLRAGEPHTFRLPLTAPLTGRKVPIEIVLRGHSEARVEEWSPTLIADPPLVVTTVEQTWRALTRTRSRRHAARLVSGRNLPHAPQAYGTIDALIIDQAGLMRLDEPRLSALLGYLGGCGRLIALGMTPDIAARLRGAAGCERQLFSAVQNAEAVPAALDRVLLIDPVPLPPVAALRSSLERNGTHGAAALTVVIFAAAYVLLVVIVARSLFPVWLVFALPVLASLLVPLVWLGRAPDMVTVTWAELYDGEQVARTATLIQLHGNGRGTGGFSLPGAYGLPVRHRWPSRRPPQVEVREDALTVTLPVRLLAREELLFVGTTELVSPIRVTVSADGPHVHNTGGHSTRSGSLFWNDERFILPALGPGAQWSAAGASPTHTDTALGLWLATHTRRGTASVLLPLPRRAGDGGPAPTGADARWLLVRSIAPHTSRAEGRT